MTQFFYFQVYTKNIGKIQSQILSEKKYMYIHVPLKSIYIWNVREIAVFTRIQLSHYNTTRRKTINFKMFVVQKGKSDINFTLIPTTTTINCSVMSLALHSFTYAVETPPTPIAYCTYRHYCCYCSLLLFNLW